MNTIRQYAIRYTSGYPSRKKPKAPFVVDQRPTVEVQLVPADETADVTLERLGRVAEKVRTWQSINGIPVDAELVTRDMPEWMVVAPAARSVIA